MPVSGFEKHDHDHCIANVMQAADARADEEGLRLTPIRRRVLEILAEDHKALGAYDILARLQAEGRAAQPPVAYRALDFLTKHGFVHRIEKLNAYVACHEPGDAHAPIFMICRSCDAVSEAGAGPAVNEMTEAAKAAGFEIEASVMEAEGLCQDCADRKS